jgi:hypothetical protein
LLHDRYYFNQGDLNVDLRWSQQRQEAVIDPGDDSLSTNVSFVSEPARKEWATGANDKGKVLAVNWFDPIEALAKGCEALPKGGKSAQQTYLKNQYSLHRLRKHYTAQIADTHTFCAAFRAFWDGSTVTAVASTIRATARADARI